MHQMQTNWTPRASKGQNYLTFCDLTFPKNSGNDCAKLISTYLGYFWPKRSRDALECGMASRCLLPDPSSPRIAMTLISKIQQACVERTHGGTPALQWKHEKQQSILPAKRAQIPRKRTQIAAKGHKSQKLIFWPFPDFMKWYIFNKCLVHLCCCLARELHWHLDGSGKHAVGNRLVSH